MIYTETLWLVLHRHVDRKFIPEHVASMLNVGLSAGTVTKHIPLKSLSQSCTTPS